MRATCDACPHACSLSEGQCGLCRARVAHDGTVVPNGYGQLTSLALDPIEKKPIARFMPGTRVLSVGSYGCNMRCPFCQNDSISYAGRNDVACREVRPDELVQLACGMRDQGCVGMAFTYNEPLISWEYVHDAAQLAHDAGLITVLVSNGMCTTQVLGQLEGLIDAANIDLKCFDAGTYADVLGGDLSCVRRTIETLAAWPDCHLEVTTLVVPGISDDASQIDAAASWLASLDSEMPYHLTRFFPHHDMLDTPATPLATMRQLAEVARRHLSCVLLGNC